MENHLDIAYLFCEYMITPKDYRHFALVCKTYAQAVAMWKDRKVKSFCKMIRVPSDNVCALDRYVILPNGQYHGAAIIYKPAHRYDEVYYQFGVKILADKYHYVSPKGWVCMNITNYFNTRGARTHKSKFERNSMIYRYIYPTAAIKMIIPEHITGEPIPLTLDPGMKIKRMVAYYETKQIKCTGTIWRHEFIGRVVGYSRSGKKEYIANYGINGKYAGPQLDWYPNGKLRAKAFVCDNGRVVNYEEYNVDEELILSISVVNGRAVAYQTEPLNGLNFRPMSYWAACSGCEGVLELKYSGRTL